MNNNYLFIYKTINIYIFFFFLESGGRLQSQVFQQSQIYSQSKTNGQRKLYFVNVHRYTNVHRCS